MRIIPEHFSLVHDRCTFFRDRVEAYAAAKGLSAVQVVEHLQGLAQEYGERAITGIIDKVVPAHLHSMNMPKIKETVS